jgi:subtilisin-like proprotein convertase family protein
MLSVNPELSASEVRSILMATADRNLDTVPDLPNDPNLQAKTGEFVAGRSLFFGSGKVNAFRAVSRARALNPEGAGGIRQGIATVNLPIPDNNPQGVVSSIEITGAGLVHSISVSVDISHTYRGDLGITLVSPEGFTANLHRVFEGGAADDLVHTYTTANNEELANLASGGVQGKGSWRLHVTDRVSRDTGVLNSWSINLLPPA